jgi:hypothetical protein
VVVEGEGPYKWIQSTLSNGGDNEMDVTPTWLNPSSELSLYKQFLNFAERQKILNSEFK